MQAYTGFASVYDAFMENIPYDDWAEYIEELLREYGIRKGIICELGCGTGSMTRRLAALGYDMIGIDNAEEMLEIARTREYVCDLEDESAEKSKQILYLEQDMREFELYGTAAAVLSLCDSLNYMTNKEDMLKVFRLVNNYLDPGGIFIFDLKTLYFYKYVLGDSTIAENRQDCSIIWENTFFEDTMLNQYEITIYKKAGYEEEALYERMEEVHLQRAYSLDEIKCLLKEAGMEFVAAYGNKARRKPDETTERMYIVAREGYQENKFYKEQIAKM